MEGARRVRSRFVELLHLQLVATPVDSQLFVLGDQVRDRDADYSTRETYDRNYISLNRSVHFAY